MEKDFLNYLLDIRHRFYSGSLCPEAAWEELMKSDLRLPDLNIRDIYYAAKSGESRILSAKSNHGAGIVLCERHGIFSRSYSLLLFLMNGFWVKVYYDSEKKKDIHFVKTGDNKSYIIEGTHKVFNTRWSYANEHGGFIADVTAKGPFVAKGSMSIGFAGSPGRYKFWLAKEKFFGKDYVLPENVKCPPEYESHYFILNIIFRTVLYGLDEPDGS